MSAFNSVIEAASAYAELGLPIIPIRAGTKVPATPRGKDDATVDPAQISDWFERNPSNGVGILTGPKSGVMVLDKDPRNGGEESYQRFIEEHGPLSLTPVVETGGGGTHHYFSVPVGWTAGDRTNIPGYPGLDLKCGGYCVAPPSLHPSGAYYRWAEGRSPSEVPLAPLPGALRAILSKPKLPSGGTTSIAEGGIRSGSRNDTLFLRASKLHRQGYTNAEVSGAIHALNQFTCNPPLEDREVDTLVRSATGYEVTPRGDQSDLDNARRLVEARSGLIRYNTASKQWLIWAGTHWKRDDNQEMMRRAKACADRLSEEAEGLNDPAARKLQKAFALKSKSARSLKAALELAASEPGVPISANEFDRQSHLLNVANGTVDLRTGKLRAHNPDDLITKLIDVSYDPAATCETWQRFLADVTGHDCELQQYLKVAFGYASTGETSEQCIFLLYGSGANGKSTCLDAIRTVLGPYALQSSIETFLSKPTGGIPNDLARLHGARFVTASEADAGRRMAESLVKEITGGEMIVARYLYGEWFEYKPCFSLFLGVNHRPQLNGADPAIWRRIRQIPFTVVIPADQRDRDLPSKLRAEAPGILRWMIEGATEWYSGGLVTPKAVLDATEDYRSEMDLIGKFIDDCCDCSLKASVASTKISNAYRAWCHEEGVEPMTQTALGRELSRRGYSDKKTGGRKYRIGLQIKSITIG